MTEPVYIDDRAGSRDLVKWRPLHDAELCRLDSGDVQIIGNGPDGPILVGVELKSIWDLLSSASTGRLQGTQIPAMLDEYEVSWLLYYGDIRPSSRDHYLQIRKGKSWRRFKLGKQDVPYSYLAGLLLELTALGIHVKQVKDEYEAALWIAVLHRWWSKPWHKHKAMRTFDKSGSPGLMPNVDQYTKIKAKFANSIPGVGFERALTIAYHFESPRAMCEASIEDWCEIDGIGKTIAETAVDALNNEDWG